MRVVLVETLLDIALSTQSMSPTLSAVIALTLNVLMYVINKKLK